MCFRDVNLTNMLFILSLNLKSLLLLHILLHSCVFSSSSCRLKTMRQFMTPVYSFINLCSSKKKFFSSSFWLNYFIMLYVTSRASSLLMLIIQFLLRYNFKVFICNIFNLLSSHHFQMGRETWWLGDLQKWKHTLLPLFDLKWVWVKFSWKFLIQFSFR